VKSISDDGGDNLFISDLGKGMLILNVETGKKISLNMERQQIVNDWVMSLYRDRQGLLWIGTTDGVSCIDTRNGNQRPYGWIAMMRNHRFDAICEMPDGKYALRYGHRALFLPIGREIN
jgi:ligand-binding sensor domain-containing protein